MASSNGYFNSIEAGAAVICKMYKVYSAKILPNVCYKLQDVNCATKLLVASILVFNIQCILTVSFLTFIPSAFSLPFFSPSLLLIPSFCLFIPVSLSVYLSVCLSVRLPACLSVCVSVCLSISVRLLARI